MEKTHAGRDWGQKEKGKTEDEMVGWHHGLNGQDTIKKIKRQSTEWEEIIASHLYSEDIISRIYKEQLELNKKTNNPN